MKNFIFKVRGRTFALSAGITSFLLGSSLASANGITYSGGIVTFTEASSTAINLGIGNALGNLWAGFLFILPYLGVALGILLVISVVMMLVKRGRS